MQDTFSLVLNHGDDSDVDFIGIFDGHGKNGENVARFVGQNICDIVLHKFRHQQKEDFCECIVEGCMELDELIRSDNKRMRDERGRGMGGTTSLSAWFRGDTVHVANVGDSRAVASVYGEAVALTDDHKPSRKEEKYRIVKAGGFVANDRVMETLAVARSFGDFGFKERTSLTADEQMVVARPEITIVKLVEDVDFLLLATDGIWDRLSNQQAVDLARSAVAEQARREETLEWGSICQKLVDECMKISADVGGEGPQDNMTVMLAVSTKQ